jgi:FO synthase subunit 1
MQSITYSPSWTLIPTHYCRNTCGYCAFVERDGARANLLSLARATEEIERARRSGASELLIMSGEGVETSASVRRALAAEGFADYIAYLVCIARRALAAGLLPHINIGNVTENEIRLLREVTPSMGMMLETTEDLSNEAAHRRAPDKLPARRLATLQAAGRARVPWTTGILVGIGESRESRRASLEAIARIHDEYKHIQEVIVQPFTPHAETTMSTWSAPTVCELRDAVSLAREVLPRDVVVQIPPNIAPDIIEFVGAGARDFGGISPDGDRINPDERWLAPRAYARVLAAHGFSLQPRLAVHERFINRDWLAAESLAAIPRVRRRLHAHVASPAAYGASTTKQSNASLQGEAQPFIHTSQDSFADKNATSSF